MLIKNDVKTLLWIYCFPCVLILVDLATVFAIWTTRKFLERNKIQNSIDSGFCIFHRLITNIQSYDFIVGLRACRF